MNENMRMRDFSSKDYKACTKSTGFLGVCEKGPSTPTKVSSFEQFQAIFGSYVASTYETYRYLAYSVEQYFFNGGKTAYIMRVEDTIASCIDTGLEAFCDIPDINILCAPGICDLEVQKKMISFCENRMNCFAILDLPQSMNSVDELSHYQTFFDSSYGAIYHPWIQCATTQSTETIFIPPSGSIAGMYNRLDTIKGIHKAPANEEIKGCLGVSVSYEASQQEILRSKGVNLVRNLPGRGIYVWGNRTLSKQMEWKEIQTKRLMMFLDEWISNDLINYATRFFNELLWEEMKSDIQSFLKSLWKEGALMGFSLEEACYVRVDKSTMSEDDILNNRIVCEIGVALMRPAQFMTIRYTQQVTKDD